MRASLALLALLACTDSADDDTTESGDGIDYSVLYAFPILQRERMDPPAMGMDHDPEVHTGAEQVICANYEGRPYPRCYDGHSGTDYILEGGFDAMDADSATIVAAAAGEVVETEDGHYDRCHADLATFEVSCDGEQMASNHVVILHPDGWRTSYHHMKRGTVAVEVGQTVERGDPLGIVGSSGNSSLPHLHFGVTDPDGERFDPYAGPYSQETSRWCDQGHPDLLPGDCP